MTATTSTRSYLRQLGDDVAAQITVVAATARKQRCLAALQVAAQVKKARDLQGALK